MKAAVFRRLEHSVQLLALPPKEQLELLPPFVCKGDELALEFGHWRRVVLSNYEKDLSIDQLSAIAELANKFTWLTTQGTQYWTDAAMQTAPEWQGFGIWRLACLRSLVGQKRLPQAIRQGLQRRAILILPGALHTSRQPVYGSKFIPGIIQLAGKALPMNPRADRGRMQG